jgi:hypothetical protein
MTKQFKTSAEEVAGYLKIICVILHETEHIYSWTDLLRKVQGNNLVHRGQHFFFKLLGLWVSKDAEFFVDFKNIKKFKLTLVVKCTWKGYLKKKA